MTESTNLKAKIGLALGSGAAKGIAHIGVIKALNEAQIPIDYIAGTSMGALVGACYSVNADLEVLEEIALTYNLNKLARLLDPRFAFIRVGLLRGNRIENFLKPIIGDVDFSRCKIPFSAVASEIKTGTEIILQEGSLLKAVRASISIPVVFEPVDYNGIYLVDGGVCNPVPADIVRSMGATFTIAVNVLNHPKRLRRLGLTGNKKSEKAPSLMNSLIQSIYIMEYEMVRSSILKADILIEPDVSNIEPYEFYRGANAIEAGYKAAQDVIPEIKKLLKSDIELK
ncbi:MAG: patatin-like phospholipase family protein [Dehalococcoidia bacterium]|nr:patatin-like phospholipase family protein [Dehalococcoidia bacterium]